MKRILLYSTVLALSLLTLSACKLGRFVWYNFANITDHRIFPARTLAPSAQPFVFAVASPEKAPKTLTLNGKEQPFDTWMERNKTVAFLIIRHDSILMERYYRGYGRESVVASFSMAKSWVAALVGIALEEKKLASLDEPFITYFPELKNRADMAPITLRHLLDMCSGIEFKESYYNPFGDAATSYYGRDLLRQVKKLKVKEKPGQRFEYISINTQLLGMVLSRAYGRPLTEVLNEKLWQPLGAEYPASWSLDKSGGEEKAFCCLNARARDFAKLGLVYRNGGLWQGRQLVPRNWVERTQKEPNLVPNTPVYGNHFWHTVVNGQRTGDYYAQGILGQYCYVHPETGIVIVRLGEDKGPDNIAWPYLMRSLAEAYGKGE